VRALGSCCDPDNAAVDIRLNADGVEVDGVHISVPGGVLIFQVVG